MTSEGGRGERGRREKEKENREAEEKLIQAFLLLSMSYSTVEPPNNGHVGTRHFVLYREVVRSSEVKNKKVELLDHKVCPL